METSQKDSLYLLLLFLLPTQLGKHFWPAFSFIGGIRVDYLSPTLYLTDIVIFLLLLCEVSKITQAIVTNFSFKKFGLLFQRYPFLAVAGVSIFVGIFLASRPVLAVIGVVRIGEVLVIALYTKRFLQTRANGLFFLIVTVSLAVLLQAFLVLVQGYLQHSLGGIFYFFGERSFLVTSPGVANANLSGRLFLRPYGTFSHPNTLASYLLLMNIILLGFLTQEWSMRKAAKICIFGAFLLGSVALLLTLSRVAILLSFFTFSAILFAGIKKSEKRRETNGLLVVLILLSVLVSILSPLLFYRFTSHDFFAQSLQQRLLLTEISIRMIIDHPFFGVGVNGFLVQLPNYLLQLSFSLLQPVHNLYLLVASETGVFGLAGFLSLLFRLAMRVRKQKSVILFCLLFSVVIFGMSDHFFMTQQQGRLLLGFVFGYIFSDTSLRIPLKKKY